MYQMPNYKTTGSNEARSTGVGQHVVKGPVLTPYATSSQLQMASAIALYLCVESSLMFQLLTCDEACQGLAPTSIQHDWLLNISGGNKYESRKTPNGPNPFFRTFALALASFSSSPDPHDPEHLPFIATA